MKKKIIISLIFIIGMLLALSLVVYVKVIKKDIPKSKINWSAKYIWLNQEFPPDTPGNPKDDTWVCFRKKFNIENKNDIKEIIAGIAVDSKYWLYINDEVVIREGAVKRGEKPDSIYYDEVDITKYLKKGENTISVLVWYWGRSAFSHIDSTQGALLFQTEIGNQKIISDETWKVIKNEAYLKDVPVNNGRLSEGSIYYDATKEIEDWYKSEYDDSKWETPIVLGNAGDLPWGELIARDIPQFKFSEIKEYNNSKDYENYITTQDELLVMDLPYNTQVTPYFKIESKANQKIYISLDENYDEYGKPQRTTYITKDGVQEFESLAWINGEKIYYFIPAGVKIISLGYRETGYDTEMVGKFVSDDEMFNNLWNMANRTLYVNMRDNYMDCPDRERALWWGDNSISMLEAMYGLDTKANALYEKSVKSLIGWKQGTVLMTVVPPVKSNMHLPVQMLLGINSMYEYYQYNGNKDFLTMIYPSVKDYLNNWTIDSTSGLAILNNYYSLWQWGDSSGETDYFALENAWYYYALKATYNMANEIGDISEIIELKGKIDNFYTAFNNNFWKEEGYKDRDIEGFDGRLNAVAVLSGLAGEDKYEKISKILLESTDNSTFMEKYILEALCKMNKIEEAQDRIKSRYSIMVENKDEYSSTLWEYWEKDVGSQNHAWAGGPMIIMSKYFAGIEPLKPGYEEISIKPNFGYLKNIESSVTTLKGEINLIANKTDNQIELKVEVPEKTLLGIEKLNDNPQIIINNKKIYSNGKEKNRAKIKYHSDDEKYIYIYVEKGDYKIISK